MLKRPFISLIVLFLLLEAGKSLAQETSDSFENKHSFGLNLGFTTGFGFSYRFMPKRLGVEIAAIPIIRTKESIILCQGISLNYIFKSHKRSDFFVYAGNGLIFEHKEYTKTHYHGGNYPYKETIEVTEDNYIYRAGLGAGWRIRGNKKWDFTIKAGAVYLSDLLTYKRIVPSGGLGLHFRIE